MKSSFRFVILLTAFTSFVTESSSQKTNEGSAIRMNHLAFQVSDLQKSTDFYMHIIGLDSIAEPFHDGKHTWLSLGNGSHLHLIQKTDPPAVIPGKNTHLCFSIASVPLFLKVLEKEKIAWEDWPGLPMSMTTRVDGVHQVYFKDPDGYWIEINDAKE